MTSKKKETRILGIVIGILIITGVGLSGIHYMREPYNSGFIEYSKTTTLHIIPGVIYLLLAPFQFLTSIRTKWIDFHRWVGRLLFILTLLVGATAFFMAVVIPFSGKIESVIVGFFALLFLLAIVKGFISIRSKNILLHREWMIRAFSLGIAIATSRIIFLPLFFSLVSPTLEQVKTLFIISFALAFIGHVIIAELWIRKTRAQHGSLPTEIN